MAYLVDPFIARLIQCADLVTGKVTDVLKSLEEINCVLNLAEREVVKEASMLELEADIAIVGDTHGQYIDLLRIFENVGIPPQRRYLFLGDYVDRGAHSLETICLLFALKVRHPAHIFLLRGNHECSSINRVYGFYDECVNRFKINARGLELWQRFQQIFNMMPLVSLVGGRILCMHGGISPDLKHLDQLRNLPRPIDPTAAGLHTDLLWADPDHSLPSGPDDPHFVESTRGISHRFTRSAVIKACTDLNIDMVVRAHQVVQDGYEFFAARRLVTLFSAPNYCGEFNNKAAVMLVDKTHQCSFVTIEAHKAAKKPRRLDETDIDSDLDALIDSESDSDASTSERKMTP